MKVALYTPLPRLAGELCEVLRLFWAVEGFAVAPTRAMTPEDTLKAQYTATPVTDDMEPLTHTFDGEGGLWRCTFTLRGQSAVRTLNPLAPDNNLPDEPDEGDEAGEPEEGKKDTKASSTGELSIDRLSAGEPPTGDPFAGEPSAGEPSAGEPSAGEPFTGKPFAGEPSTSKPSAHELSAGEPSTGKPSAGLPSAGEPSAGEPSTSEPSAGEPSAGVPSAGELSANEPSISEPLAGLPSAGEPSAGVPFAHEPSAGELFAHELSAGEPFAGEPPAGKLPAGKLPVGEPSADGQQQGAAPAGTAINGLFAADKSFNTSLNARCAQADTPIATAKPGMAEPDMHGETAVPRNSQLHTMRLQKRLCKLTLYDLCKQLTGHTPPWGSLTGIRPTRLLYEKLAQGMSLAQGAQALTAQFDVSPEKAALLARIVAVQLALPAPRAQELDVYVSIPFCRTRCAYCSFPGEALGKGRQVKPYLDALFAEMAEAATLLSAGGYALRALYIGGGTPTALGEAEFAALLDTVGTLFPNPLEFTVEAGRPDTITHGKLAAMLAHGVTRVSVNPQTMNDDILAAIGRGHTAAETVTAFRLARQLGFANINMDVIAGLPGETPAHFARTMAAIRALAPDSLTVHTLAIKRASRLHLTGAPSADAGDVAAMVQMGEEAALQMGMEPYYLYRQKHMAGQQQNVGYARGGAACLYNIDIMEEICSVLACGAGAISKRVYADRGLRIERAPNVTNVGVYVQRVADMAARKQALFG